MNVKSYQQVVLSLLILGAAALPLRAQEGAMAKSAASSTKGAWNRGGFEGGGWTAQLNNAVQLTPEQRDSVRGLLSAQREEKDAMYARTNGKIRELLNADQQVKFDKFLAESKKNRRRS